MDCERKFVLVVNMRAELFLTAMSSTTNLTMFRVFPTFDLLSLIGFRSFLVLIFAFQAALCASPDSESGFVAGHVVDQVVNPMAAANAPPPNRISFHGAHRKLRSLLFPFLSQQSQTFRQVSGGTLIFMSV